MTERITEQEIAELEALEKAASPTPWSTDTGFAHFLMIDSDIGALRKHARHGDWCEHSDPTFHGECSLDVIKARGKQ